MMYVEWLRVRNVARVLAIVLGIFLLIALVLRISFNSELSLDSKYITTLIREPGTKVTTSTQPSGLERKTIYNPAKNETIVIDDTGGGGRRVSITEPRSSMHGSLDHGTVGSVHFDQSASGEMVTTTIDTNGSVPFLYFMIGADLMAFVIATLLATPFARENDGHLEFALTKPISRTANALGIIGVDLVGIALCSFMTVVAMIIGQAMFEVPHFDFSGINSYAIVMGFAFPFAWYAMLNAATASLSRGYGAIQGFAWPVAILVVVFSMITWGDSAIGQAVHNIFWVISRIDPLSYVGQIMLNEKSGEFYTSPNFLGRLGLEMVLFVVYTVLAVVQWRRVEA